MSVFSLASGYKFFRYVVQRPAFFKRGQIWIALVNFLKDSFLASEVKRKVFGKFCSQLAVKPVVGLVSVHNEDTFSQRGVFFCKEG